MLRDLLRWCVGDTAEYVPEWTPQRAERAYWATERYLAGTVVSRARVVGSRRLEAIIADRERRLAEMKRREIHAVDEGKVA